MRLMFGFVLGLLLVTAAIGSQGHAIAWGSWKTITLASGRQIKIRPLVIDGRVKEYSTGSYHQITEKLTVVRQVIRINNALPSGAEKNPQWVWELGGWVSVNSTTGHIAEIKLPEFDNRESEASWFQDYAAYCGTAEDGNVHYVMVFEIGKRRPLLRKAWSNRSCAAPEWDKDPIRVTFEAPDGRKLRFSIHDNIAELQSQ